ncbi:HAMP domain-containing histidine kinase [Bacillus infantis]|uniref:sensor histidine kinase n=1 Tax=Bacillus infantis TaxID=324767 RepID=UPI001CD31921|nr:HAMP domain-containing sensor histidine kinase [Bacillus infantis]MCA1042225.1 HAMP domain-containing histidine kinase [Bacillus infantis]
MLRNKEYRNFLFIAIGLAVLCVLLSSLISWQAALAAGTSSLLLLAAFLIFTSWRYREIDKLSRYLRRISSGDYMLDVRDNHEGELSILKSEIYKVTIRLSEQSALLQEDKTKLTDAISDISHQLKTPLTSMMVMSDLLSDMSLEDGKRKEFTRRIQVQLERIEWLVSSLLKLSKIDAGTAFFKTERVDVPQLVKEAVEPLLIPMELKEQELRISGRAGVFFTGDHNWTKEALINIIKNSIEHSREKGSISISYSQNPLLTEIIIEDDGGGILKEDLPYIFKRFYRGKNATEDSVGIGLAMAYGIMKRQGGDIEVASKQGFGTRFTLKFYHQVI